MSRTAGIVTLTAAGESDIVVPNYYAAVKLSRRQPYGRGGPRQMAVLPRWMWGSGVVQPREEREVRQHAVGTPLSTWAFGLLTLCGVALVAASWITARLKVDALRAEQRDLLLRIADLDAQNRVLQTEIARGCSSDVIAAADVELDMVEPAAIDVVSAPALVAPERASASDQSPVGRALRMACDALGARLQGAIAPPPEPAPLRVSKASEQGPSRR
ncbi:MAG: hypothetical protein ACE5O2_01645 [Armatimonadota bacterium]